MKPPTSVTMPPPTATTQSALLNPARAIAEHNSPIVSSVLWDSPSPMMKVSFGIPGSISIPMLRWVTIAARRVPGGMNEASSDMAPAPTTTG